jgi:hypothetical protein
MKNIIRLLFLLVIFSSCEEDFLEKAPNYAPSVGTYFISEDAAQEARIGVYSRTASVQYLQQVVFAWDGMTDQLFDQYNSWKELSVARGELNPSIGGIVSGFYADAYKVIAAANDLIKNIGAMDDDLFEDLTKEHYIADAQFFKAYFYFYLTELYGGVPLYKSSLNSIEESKVAKTSKAEIVEYILNELDVAIANLPTGSFDGYIKKGTAQTLKAKILLHNERWSEAAAVANEVILSGDFDLHPDYFDIFIKKGQPGNKEIIFSSDYKYPEFAHNLTRFLVHSAHAVPRHEFVNSYLMTDGLPPGVSSLDSSNYQNRDPRLYMSVRLPSDIWYDDNGAPINWEPTWTGFYMFKFLDPLLNDASSIHNHGTSEQSIVHLRYADLLLMYAEAKFQLGEFDQAVADQTINLIRARSGMATVTDVASLSNSEKFDLIKYERNIELAFERHHFFDLKRWGILGETLLSLADPAGVTMVWHDYFNLWPFSNSELILNPNLVQNTGY